MRSGVINPTHKDTIDTKPKKASAPAPRRKTQFKTNFMKTTRTATPETITHPDTTEILVHLFVGLNPNTNSKWANPHKASNVAGKKSKESRAPFAKIITNTAKTKCAILNLNDSF